MRIRVLRLFLVPVAVGAVLLTGCAEEEPESAQVKTNVSFKPVPSVTVSAPTDNGVKVIQWYGSGGAKLLNDLISASRSAKAQHEANKIVIDLGYLSSSLEAARGYTVAYIPDQKTHDAWTQARQDLSDGMGMVLNASGLGVARTTDEKAAEASANGWARINKGIDGLKATDDRLRAFGCLPTEDPWK